MSEINFKKHKERDLIFFNDAIEYFEKFDASEELVNSDLVQTSNFNDNPNFLRDQMLVELNNLKDIEISTGRKVYTILQLRHHPEVLKIKNSIKNCIMQI